MNPTSPFPPPSPRRAGTTLALLAALALLAPACASARDAKKDREQRLAVHTESAALYLNMGEYERAVDQAQRGLELDPESFVLRLYLGRALQKIGGTNEILTAEKVFRSLPAKEDFRVPLGLAEVLERKGLAQEEAAEAIEAGRRFTAAPDRAARGAELRAEARATWRESDSWYARALELQAGDIEVLSGLARVHALLGNLERSLEWSATLLDTLARDRAFWRTRLEQPGLSASDQERLLQQVRVLDDLTISVRRKAASLERELGRTERALAQLDAVLAIDPGLAPVHAVRAQLLAGLGRHRDALIGLERFLELSAGLPFEHPDVQQAMRLRGAWQRELARAAAEAAQAPRETDGAARVQDPAAPPRSRD